MLEVRSGVQPVGQLMIVGTGGGGDLEIDQRTRRNGRQSRYCGRPGNRAMRNMLVAIRVKYLCWVIVVKDMIDLLT